MFLISRLISKHIRFSCDANSVLYPKHNMFSIIRALWIRNMDQFQESASQILSSAVFHPFSLEA